MSFSDWKRDSFFWGRCLELSTLTCKALPTNGKELSDDTYKIVGSVNDDIWWRASNLSVIWL